MLTQQQVAALRKRLADDPDTRRRFMTATKQFYESLGIDLDADQLKKLTDEAIKEAATSKRVEALSRTVAIITVL